MFIVSDYAENQGRIFVEGDVLPRDTDLTVNIILKTNEPEANCDLVLVYNCDGLEVVAMLFPDVPEEIRVKALSGDDITICDLSSEVSVIHSASVEMSEDARLHELHQRRESIRG
jgi:hypothetical protein